MIDFFLNPNVANIVRLPLFSWITLSRSCAMILARVADSLKFIVNNTPVSLTSSTNSTVLPHGQEASHSRVVIRAYKESDRSQAVQLWIITGLYHPDNDPYKDIDRKIADSPELFFVAIDNNKVIGTVMVGYEGHRGWINYLCVLPQYQRRNIGRELMKHAEKALIGLGCAKINLQIRKDNIEVISFYKSIGYVVEDVISMEMRLEFDN